MKTKELLLGIAMIILVGLNLFWINRFNNQSVELKTLKSFANQTQSLNNEIQFRDDYIHKLSFGSVLSNTQKVSIQENNSAFCSALANGEKVIFFYKEDACASCLIKVYQDLDILAEKIGKDKIVIASTWEVPNALINPDSLGFANFPVKTLNILIEELNQPFLFLTDHNLDLKYLLVPELFDNLRQEYFTEVIPSYFAN